MIYNRDGNPVQGEKALYYTHKRVPREKYILNEKTGEFERVRISRRVKNNRVGTNINGARKNKSIKSINLKRIILRTINKYKANKKISEHDFDR